MKMQSRILAVLLGLVCLVGGMALAEETVVSIAVLKGPTGMGAAPLMAANEQGETQNQYEFTIAGTPDVLVSQIVTGELDMAALPTNTIAMLSAKTEGEVQMLAVNTLGVLYVLERGDSVQSIDDLRGKTIVSAGRGTVVEAVANYLFDDSVTIDYVAEHAESVGQAVSGNYDLVLLSEPFVTALLAKDPEFSIAIDVTAAWEERAGSQLTIGGIAVRRSFAEENPQVVATFLEEYAQSVAYANAYPQETAAMIESFDIMTAAVAEKAIPRVNIVCLTGAEMKEALVAFYTVLEGSDPALMGGAMPEDAFYFGAQ